MFIIMNLLNSQSQCNNCSAAGGLSPEACILINALTCTLIGNMTDWHVSFIQQTRGHLQRNCRFKVGFNGGVSYRYNLF
jgi:hypothetical protein